METTVMDKKNVSWVKRQCDDTTRLEPRPSEQKHDDHTASPQGTHNLEDSLCFSVVKESLTRTSFARSDWSEQNTIQNKRDLFNVGKYTKENERAPWGLDTLDILVCLAFRLRPKNEWKQKLIS